MNDVLEKICDAKQAHISARKAILPAHQLAEMLRQVEKPRDFLEVLCAKINAREFGLIAEIKKASPSAGLIRENFDVANIARAYASGGAACLSVLTDAPFFQGDDKNIAFAKSACPLPVLRKDFMLDVYQVDESRLLGADAILIIMAAVTNETASALNARARQLGMVSIFEVHNIDELDRALSLFVQPQIIGINHRNLKTLEIDLRLSAQLAAKIPPNILVVAESGLKTNADLLRIQKDANINAFLIGETLMKQPDITAATQKILNSAA